MVNEDIRVKADDTNSGVECNTKLSVLILQTYTLYCQAQYNIMLIYVTTLKKTFQSLCPHDIVRGEINRHN